LARVLQVPVTVWTWLNPESGPKRDARAGLVV